MAPRFPRPSANWLLVLGSAICFLIADGCTYSFGIFYTELSAVFAEDNSPTLIALLSGMLYGLPQISGPLVCPLIEAVGPWRACGLGCMCVSLSFALGSFARTFIGMLLMLGVVTSVGLELLYATALSVVLRHFHRWRGLATGMTVFGGGLGALLFAEVYAALERRYTWRGAMLVEAGIFTHTAVAASLYLVLEGRIEEEEKEEGEEAVAHASGQELLNYEVRQSCSNSQVNCANDSTVKSESVVRYVESCSDKQPQLMSIEAATSYTINETSSSSNEPNKTNSLALFWHQLVTSFKAMRHPVLWRLPFVHFRLISLLNGIFILQPWIFIHSYAVALGTPPAKANHLLSVMGISYAVGQIVFGILADLANAYLLYGVCLLICGVACLLMGFLSAFGSLASLGAAFGLGMGGTMAMFGLLLVDMVGEQHLYPAFGVFLPFVGVGNLVSGPLCAWLATQMSYRAMFTIGGVGLIGVGILFAPLVVRSVVRFGLKSLNDRR